MNVPVAVNCCVVPSGIVEVAGVITIETSVAAVTVSSVELLTLPELAVTVVVPAPLLCASPAVLIVAVVVVSEAQVAELVRSFVVPSVNVPVAVNCCVVPRAIDGVAGVTAIETRAAALTVRLVDPVTEPEVAVMLAVPSPWLLASPWKPAVLLIVATAVASEAHCTVVVMFCVLLSV